MRSLLTLACTLFLFTSMTSAQEVSVDEIVDTYFENIGGKDAWREIKSMKFSGEGVQMGMKFPVTMLNKEPNLTRLDVSIQGMTLTEAYDGEVAWGTNPFAGQTEPQKKTDEESAEAGKENFQDDLLDYKEKGSSLTMEGTEEYEGSEVYKLKLTRDDGEERIYFFDTELYIPIAMRMTVNSGPMKGQVIDAVSSDFQEVDGVMIPFSFIQKVGGQTMLEFIANEVEINVPLTDEEFAFPGN